MDDPDLEQKTPARALVERLLEPARAAPQSLGAQLRWIRLNWAGWLDEGDLRQHRHADAGDRRGRARGVPPPPPSGSRRELADGPAGRVGPNRPTSRRRSARTGTGCRARAHRQVARTSGSTSSRASTAARSGRLDQIPDEELDRTRAHAGFTGLWLIGLWERSHASQRDQADARQPRRRRVRLLARRLPHRRRPRRRGRLAGPARPGVGARHPPGERHGAQPHGHRLALGHGAPRAGSLARRSALSGATASTGPDLSHGRARRHLPRGPLLGRDATPRSSFQRVDRWSGETRYIYHGNDGTSMPWNDTAQLDYLQRRRPRGGHRRRSWTSRGASRSSASTPR